MKIKFEALLTGAEAEDIWLCDLKHSKLKKERKKIVFGIRIGKKYNYLKRDSRWDMWFDTEESQYICYELIYIENVKELSEKDLVDKKISIFKECEKLTYLINCYFGTIIGINFGNFYINDKSNEYFCNRVLYLYNPSILEDYTKIEMNKENLKKFLENVEVLMKSVDRINIVLETYNINLSIPNIKIAYLNLITCLESMLANSNSELSYQISRSVAVLLSKNKEQGNNLFRKMKMLYGLRSKFVHNGVWKVEKYYKIYENDPFEDLKEIFILSFRKFMNLNLDKVNFIKRVDECGYGDLND